MIVATTKIAEKPINDTIKPMPESIASFRLDWTSCSNSFIATPPNSILSIDESEIKIHRIHVFRLPQTSLTQIVHSLQPISDNQDGLPDEMILRYTNTYRKSGVSGLVTKIWNAIDKGTVQPVYLLTGTEQHLIDETIKKITAAVPGMTSSEVNRFDLDETPVQAVLEVADEFPFLVEHKVIIAKNCSFLKAADQSKDKQPHQLEQLEQWLENPSPTATVIFVAPYEKLDSRKKITKKMKAHAIVVEAETLQGRDLAAWVMQQGADKGIDIDIEEAELLIETAGTDLLTLAAEIDKLAAYLSFQGPVTAELIGQLVTRMPEVDVFRLTDSFVNGRKSESLSVYHDLLRNGEEPIMLASLIAGQVRLMVHVANLRKKGYQQQQIATALHVHPYRVKLMMQRKLPDLPVLYKALDDLATIDLQLKTMSGNRQRRLELFLMGGLTAK